MPDNLNGIGSGMTGSRSGVLTCGTFGAAPEDRAVNRNGFRSGRWNSISCRTRDPSRSASSTMFVCDGSFATGAPPTGAAAGALDGG
jgi:hypothetical protein